MVQALIQTMQNFVTALSAANEKTLFFQPQKIILDGRI